VSATGRDVAVIERSLGSRVRYRIFGQAVPSLLYGFLGYLAARSLASSIRGSHGHDVAYVIGHPVRIALYLLFCLIPIVLFLTRPVPKAREGALAARVAAFAGTVILIWAGAERGSAGRLILSLPSWFTSGAAVVFAALTALELYTLLCLRNSFSIIPEARHLVTKGPYSVVRNPLYALEIAAAVTWTASEPRLLLFAALVPFVVLQLIRIRYEERLLRTAFPEYAGYFARTRRLIPYVW